MTIRWILWNTTLGITCLAAQSAQLAAQESLLTRQPFDEITVGTGDKASRLEVSPLNFPGRQLPASRPAGSLKVRLIDRPGQTFEISWNDINGIRLYEQMVLERANELVNKDEYDAAYDYFAFLLRDYPQLPDLAPSVARYLQLNALSAYRNGNYDQALMLLGTLHDRSQDRSRLASAVERVAGKIIEQRIRNDDYAGARAVLDLWQRQFPNIGLAAIEQWQERFQLAATGHLNQAKQLIQQERYAAGQKSIRRALAIWPELPGVAELYRDIRRRYPQVIVGVFEMTPSDRAFRLDSWPTIRARPLDSQSICRLAGYSSEGGVYQSSFGEFAIDDTGRQLTLQVEADAAQPTGAESPAHDLARFLLAMADPLASAHDRSFTSLCEGVSVDGNRELTIDLARPHVRPEALLLTTLPDSLATGSFRLAQLDDSVARFVIRPGEQSTHLKAVVEQSQTNDESSVEALLRGEIDVLDRVPPWRVSQLRSVDGIRVAAYRLPSVHVLVPGRPHELVARREFRRAIAYGINRPQILNQIIAAGLDVPGFEVVSGPFPVGTSLSDPIRYAYHNQTLPRPYEPRLAATLALVAATSLEQAKRQREAEIQSAQGQSQQQDESPSTGPTAGSVDEDSDPSADTDEGRDSGPEEASGDPTPSGATDPAVSPIVLAHSRDPVARTACETIRRQLVQLGIPIELAELSTDALNSESPEFDLRYAELAMWEPVVDAHRLFGLDGLVGETSAAMRAALISLDAARNWNQVSRRLAEIHQLAHNDLPVIPLWQTVNHFAHRTELVGVDESPVTLYQSIRSWRFQAVRDTR